MLELVSHCETVTGLRRTRKSSSSNKKLQDAKLDHEKTLLSRQIEATDASIDKLVYELYGLTEEEIAVVKKGGKNNKSALYTERQKFQFLTVVISVVSLYCCKPVLRNHLKMNSFIKSIIFETTLESQIRYEAVN